MPCGSGGGAQVEAIVPELAERRDAPLQRVILRPPVVLARVLKLYKGDGVAAQCISCALKYESIPALLDTDTEEVT